MPHAPLGATAGAGQHPMGAVDLSQAPADGQVDVIAKINPQTNEPMLGDCTVHLGDGSVKVPFVRGRARVPAEVAELLKHRSDLDMPGIGHYGSPQGLAGAAGIRRAATADELEAQGPEVPSAELEELAGLRVATGEKDLALAEAQQEIARLRAQLGDPAPSEEERLALAREHLEAEGHQVEPPTKEGAEPEPSPTVVRVAVPEGYEAMTGEGEPRCLAKTSSGSQCKNAAADGGSACGLDPHKAQFAS